MIALFTLVALARADVLERTRSYGFLVFTGLMLWLGYGTYTGVVHVTLDEFTGKWNSAWAGGMMALVANVVLTLVGFWFVRHSVERDVRTRVGPILAATPLSRLAYVAGKALSHWAVLALMALVLFAAAALIQLAHPGNGPLGLADLLLPYLVVVLPALALVAALAVLCETTPVLRGPVGNGAWLFLWTGLVVVGSAGPGAWSDAFGLRALEESMWRSILAQHPGVLHPGSLNVNIGGSTARVTRTFVWGGLDLTTGYLATRLLWCAVAAALVAVAAWSFHRFDPDRMPRPGGAEPAARARRPRAARTSSWVAPARWPAPPGLVGAELRLLLAGAGPWWTLVALGAWIASACLPLGTARAIVLPALWLWALPRWSGLGARETRDATAGFVFTGPGAARRVTLAGWAAGAGLAAVLALPLALRLGLTGDGIGVAALAAGAAFVPGLALALGAVSGSGRLFEVLYVLLWYLGPMNRAAALDYTGGTAGGARPVLWGALGAAGAFAGWAAQARRLRG